MWWLDGLAINILAPLAVWVFASSLDDLILDASYLWFWFRSRGAGSRDRFVFQPAGPEPRIALLVPCWDEAGVIEEMIERNLAAIDYSNYQVWLGVYPNDAATLSKAAACSARLPGVRFVVCPREGPTTKADCLNALYEGIRRFEQETGARYDIFVQHDAEDLIHPDSLRRIQAAALEYDMVQIPVFPLETALSEFTHGTYGDFFAEFHLKELRQRAAFGGFVPSAGVGTAYRREALEALWEQNDGHLFDQDSLTEDYAIGFRLHELGRRQTLLHAEPTGGEEQGPGHPRRLPVATRSYFPKGMRQAIRQRSRWVTGIALQSWKTFGWQARPKQLYWLWRDRKGLLGHPASLLANMIFCYGVVRWLWAEQTGDTWHLGGFIGERPELFVLLIANTGMILWRQGVRGVFVGTVYGWKHGVTVPVRAPWANWIDCCATLSALGTFFIAQARRQRLTWAKTTHSYPAKSDRIRRKPLLGEILVSRSDLTAQQIHEALRYRRRGERIGETLLRQQVISETDLYRALSRQHEIPLLTLEPGAVDPGALCCLPREFADGLSLLPYRKDELNRLWIATPEAPDSETLNSISRFVSPAPRFVLITPSNYRALLRAPRRQSTETTVARTGLTLNAGHVQSA